LEFAQLAKRKEVTVKRIYSPAVHFLRFELSADMIRAAKAGAGIGMGIEHPAIPIRWTRCQLFLADELEKEVRRRN
jgi:hypothetical protein